MIKIYHNNRCRKSREGLEILEKSGKDFEVIKYLEEVPSEKELKDIIELLHIKPIELVRTNESIWKTDYKGKISTDSEVIDAMIKNPKLIERPIVVNDSEAVIGRPPELIKTIL